MRMAPVSQVDRSKADGVAQHSTERWNAASGYVVIVLGIAGAAGADITSASRRVGR